MVGKIGRIRWNMKIYIFWVGPPIQGGGEDTYMIAYSADKCPSDPVSWLFKCLSSDFLNAWMLSFDVIMIRNELCPLMFSHPCFRSPKTLFFLAWPIGAAVRST